MTRWCVAVVCVLVAGIARADGEVNPESIEAVKAAWQDRQDKIRSLRMEWTETRRLPAGSLSHFWKLVAGAGRLKIMNPDGGLVPPNDTEQVIRGKVEFGGGKAALEFGEYVWNPKTKGFTHVPIRIVFDGEVKRKLRGKGAWQMDWAQATVTKTRVFNRAFGPRGRPMFLWFRGNDPAYSCYALGGFKVRRRDVEVEGIKCLQLEQQSGNLIHRLWVAPDRGYLLIREATVRGSDVEQQITIAYERVDDLDWKISGWRTVTSEGKGKFVENATSVVTAITWNHSLASDAFVVSIPPGARVIDETLPLREQDYILRPDGGKRVIHPSEIGKSYDELLSSSPPQPLPFSRGGYGLLAVSLSMIAAVVLMVALISARWLRSWNRSRNAHEEIE